MFRPLRRPSLTVFAIMAPVLLLTPQPQAQIQNPIQAAKDAYNKAKAQAKQQQQQQQNQQQPQQQSSQQQTATTTSGAASPPQDSAAPWVPPSDSASPALGPAASAPPVKIDPARLPDVLGVHLGMTLPEALAAAHKAYPDDMFQEKPANAWPSATKPEYGYNILSRAPGNSREMALSFTAPPADQRVWMIERLTFRIHTNRNTLLAALREKYGKETIAFQDNTPTPSTSDARITTLLWLYDEQGNRIPMPPNTVFVKNGSIHECRPSGAGEPNMPVDDKFEQGFDPWCQAHLVILQVMISPLDIVENTETTLEELPLAIRNSHSAAAFLRDYAQKQHQLDLEKSKEKKPAL